MKKTLCILMAVLLLASSGTFAFAEETDLFTIDEPSIGFHYVTPEKYRNLKGSLDWNAMYLDDGIIQLTLSYYAFPPEDFQAYDDYFLVWLDAKLAGIRKKSHMSMLRAARSWCC